METSESVPLRPNPEKSHLEIDLFQDLVVGTAQYKGVKEGNCEDRIIPKFKIPLEYIKSSASCVTLGVMDGHGGSACVDYVSNRLGSNIISTARDFHKRNPSDSDTLQSVFRKSFSVTDSSYMKIARKNNDNSGSTIVTCTIFGPDPSDGKSRILLGSLGDSRAVLYRLDPSDPSKTKMVPVGSNPVHKPSQPSEVNRITAEGGRVGKINGVDRVIKQVTPGNTIGLAVSRAFGDLFMKEPKPVISSVPEFNEFVIDFERDQFVVLGSDGVFDFVSLAEIGALVASADRTQTGLQGAADEIAILAKTKGSTDDRTCVIVDFSWATRASSTHIKRAQDDPKSDSDNDIYNID